MIVVGPDAAGALGEVSVEDAASANPLNVPPGVEQPVVPPANLVAPQSPVSRGKEDHDPEPGPEASVPSFEDNQPNPPHSHAENKGEEEDDTEPDLDAIAASFADDQPDLPNLLSRKSIESSPTTKLSSLTAQASADLNYSRKVRNMF